MNKIIFILAVGAVFLVPGILFADGLDSETSQGKALFCSFGGIGMEPIAPPPGFESEFAVAVVEINSPHEIANATISKFELLDQAGNTVRFKRVVSVEVFNRPRVATEGEEAYYLNPGNTQPWDGKLPDGKIRLRIKVALPGRPSSPFSRVKIVIGPFMIEGPVSGEWPT